MRLRKNFFFKHVLLSFSSTLSPRLCLENACCNCYQKHAFGIFKSISCLILMRLRKNFFFKHVLLSFSSTLSPRSYLGNACCKVIKNTVNKRLWNFQIHFLPYSKAFEKKFFFQTCSFIIFLNFVPEVISRKCLL